MHSEYFDLSPEHCNCNTAQYSIIAVPFDKTSTYGKGADKGPEAIRAASRYVELYDIETDTTAYTAGICAYPEKIDVAASEAMIADTQNAVATILDKRQFPVVLGGEHSIAMGSVQAVASRFKDLTVLQLDAHADLRNEYEGSIYNHACAIARIREHAPVTQVGIRSMDVSEKASVESSRFFTAASIMCSTNWISRVVETLSDNVYITLDLDVFDPSIMPSTGTPEPGGLGWYQVLALLREVCSRKTLVGCDINELCPSVVTAPDFLAAKLLYKIISYHHYKTRNTTL